MHVNDIAKKQFAWLESVGWASGTTPLEDVALIASEIGEAANECRGVEPTENFPIELADIILRTLGLAEKLGIDMEAAIATKMAINKARGNRGRLK
jgi:NTP pyrophosphatase (non-canonical NTP hydrolase)